MRRLAIALAAFAVSISAFAPDHSHKAWDDLLKKHVKYVQDGNASRVDYAGFARDRAQLKSVLDDYYGKDFEMGHKGYGSVKATMAKYAEQLADRPEDRAAVRGEKAPMSPSSITTGP